MALKPRKGLTTGGLLRALPLGRQLDENVFKTRSERADLGNGDALPLELLAEMFEIKVVVDQSVNRLAENGRAPDSRDHPGVAQREGYLWRGDFYPVGALWLHIGQFAQGVRGAIGKKLAEIDVRHLAAALGFVHIVCGHEKRDALSRQFEQQVPQLTARHGIDAGGGFIEEDQLRLVQQRAAECKPLLPPTRKLCRQPILVRAKAVLLNDFVQALAQTLGWQAIDAAVKGQIFRDRKVRVEAEILRHVADVLAHPFGILPHIDAQNAGFSPGQRQQARQHLDHSGLSAAVRSEEAKDFARLDREADAVDGRERPEPSNQMLGRDRDLWVARHGSARGVQFDIGGHPRQDAARTVVDPHLYAEDLVHSLLARLHVARQELGLLVDLLDAAAERLVGEGIDADLRFLAHAYAADFGLGNVNANVDLVAF